VIWEQFKSRKQLKLDTFFLPVKSAATPVETQSREPEELQFF
jgi:hypothetical protein